MQPMPDVLYFNGRFTTTDERVLGVEDRGFQFGDGVYEVFKFVGKRPVFLVEHYRRMERSLRQLQIRSPWTETAFAQVMQELLARTEFADGIVYIQISRGEAPRAHFWPDNVEPTVVAYSRRFSFPDAAKKERGIPVITTRDRRWTFCDIKSVNLLANALAKKEAQRGGAEEAILLAAEFVREGASSNFFAVKNGYVVTHPLDEHILPGIVRDQVIALALRAKIRVDERPLREAELFDLDEAFITSTTQGVMPVTEIDGRVIRNSRRGDVTTRLQQLFDASEAER
ncbi:MAG: D-alanine transaminase [Acidobacteriota bacterium]|jgi:D-alanine transaminase|nr:D-alanine transaminase [Acidobacteriota bacterium]